MCSRSIRTCLNLTSDFRHQSSYSCIDVNFSPLPRLVVYERPFLQYLTFLSSLMSNTPTPQNVKKKDLIWTFLPNNHTTGHTTSCHAFMRVVMVWSDSC